MPAGTSGPWCRRGSGNSRYLWVAVRGNLVPGVGDVQGLAGRLLEGQVGPDPRGPAVAQGPGPLRVDDEAPGKVAGEPRGQKVSKAVCSCR